MKFLGFHYLTGEQQDSNLRKDYLIAEDVEPLLHYVNIPRVKMWPYFSSFVGAQPTHQI